MATTIKAGRKVTIPAGTRVTCLGQTSKRTQDSQVTVRSVEQTRAGKTKISWKSMGYKATAII